MRQSLKTWKLALIAVCIDASIATPAHAGCFPSATQSACYTCCLNVGQDMLGGYIPWWIADWTITTAESTYNQCIRGCDSVWAVIYIGTLVPTRVDRDEFVAGGD